MYVACGSVIGVHNVSNIDKNLTTRCAKMALQKSHYTKAKVPTKLKHKNLLTLIKS